MKANTKTLTGKESSTKKDYFMVPSIFDQSKEVIIDMDDVLDMVDIQTNFGDRKLYAIVFENGITWQTALSKDVVDRFKEKKATSKKE